MVHIPTDLPNDGVEVLVFETSPYGNLDAIVQHDGRAVYFYLNSQAATSNQAFGTRACWVRNLQQGPYVLNEDEMRQGNAPMLPRTHCKSLEPGKLPCPEDLKIVWFEEGNGAALLERNAADQEKLETLAVIPPWSGIDNFLGYAAECASESPLCWPLPDNPKLRQRIDRADEFWNAFQSSPDPFSVLQSAIIDAYQANWVGENEAAEPAYFSIDGGKFPPRGLIHYQTADSQILATVAMSLCPQPLVELFADDPKNFRRIELAIALENEADAELLNNARQALSRLAGYPWHQLNWLGHGHTCQFSGVFPNIETVLLAHDQQLNAEQTVAFPRFRDDPIQLLWLLPLSRGQQRDLAQKDKSVEQLIQSHLSKS
jgi:hypothetical protein